MLFNHSCMGEIPSWQAARLASCPSPKTTYINVWNARQMNRPRMLIVLIHDSLVSFGLLHLPTGRLGDAEPTDVNPNDRRTLRRNTHRLRTRECRLRQRNHFAAALRRLRARGTRRARAPACRNRTRTVGADAHTGARLHPAGGG